jgi:hypothetical protein
MRVRTHLALLVTLMVAGVGAVAGAQAPKPVAKPAAKKARVFFVEPKNGATVASPAHLKFGSQGIEIAAVPPGDVTKARPGIGHYHVGVDETCLASGKTIVKGTPSWVHFGDGKSEIDMQLTPGKHKLALQVADDLHNALPGLCTTITVTVK